MNLTTDPAGSAPCLPPVVPNQPWLTGAPRPERARAAIARDGLAALVALTAENAAYLSGRTSTIASLWRVPALVVVALAADGGLAVAAGDSELGAYPPNQFARHAHPFWIEHLDLRGVSGGSIAERIVAARPGPPPNRPAQFDEAAQVAAAAAAIRSAAPRGGVVGADLRDVPARLLALLAAALPGRELVDASAVFDDLRAVKDPDEIGHLRRAGELTDTGIAAARAALRPGLPGVAVTAAYQSAIWRRAATDDRYLALREAEGLVGVGDGNAPDTRVGPGETVKLDMQVDVGGYHSDIGRTYALAPTAEQRDVHAALLRASERAQAEVRPGATFADLHAAGSRAMHEAGFANYSRGHLGHSVGLAHNYEEAPFIAPDEPRPLVPGMVVSLELPYYLLGLGTFQLERMLLVTDTGHEPLDRLPFDFAVTG